MATRSRKLTGSAGAVLGYFEELRTQALESYYSPASRNGDDPADDIVFDEVWGAGAKHLGITSLTRGQFTDLANGEWDGKKLTGSGYRKVVDPVSGEERTERVRTTAIDVVLAAPKSVMEALIALDNPVLRAQVVDAWKNSVRTGFDSMEAHAAVARVPVQTPSERGPRIVEHGPNAGRESKMQGSRTKRIPAKLIAIPVIQFSARPTDTTVARGSPPDPHLHAHVVVMGVCIVIDDNGVVHTYTPDEQGIRATAAEREAVVMGEFARRLEEIGFRIDYTTDGRGTTTWEIRGSNPAIRRFFSTNGEMAHALKREFEEKHGRPPTEAELTALRDIHRRPKDADAKQVDQYAAWNRWRTEITRAALELTIPGIGRVRRPSREKREEELRDRLLSTTGLTRDDAVFTRDSMRATIVRCAVGLGFTPGDLADIEDAVAMSAVPVAEARDPRFDVFTTRTMLNAELGIARDIERRAHATAPAPKPSAVKRAIKHSPVNLDDEQRTAVERMCSSQAWVMLEGHAGTGKTSTLKAVVDAYRDTPPFGRAAADDVIVLSTAAATAERTARPLDADRSGSIDSFVAAVRHGAWKKPVEHTVTRYERGKRIDETVIRYETWTPTERTLIVVDEAAMVDTPRMAELLACAGDAKIILVGDPKQLTPIGAGGWYAEASDKHGVFELTRVYRQKAGVAEPPRKIREGAAKQALASLTEQGRVHVAEDRSHAIQRAVEMYREHRDAGRAEDDVVLIAEGSNHEIDILNRLVQRERRESGEISGPGIEVRATATARRWTLHDGDLVIFLEKYDRDRDRRNVPKDKRQRKVDNGETGVIVGIDTEHNRVVIEMARGDIVTVDLDDEARTQPLGLRYAVHIAKYQGHQTDVGIVLPGAGRITSQNSAYAQMTRPKHEAHVIVDYETHGAAPIDRLAEAWSQPDTKQTALSQLDPGDAERYRSAYDTAPGRSRWWHTRRDTRRRDGPDAADPLPELYDPMAAAHEDLDATIAKHRAKPDNEKPDTGEDDAPADVDMPDEPDVATVSDPPSWIEDPMAAAHAEAEAALAGQQAPSAQTHRDTDNASDKHHGDPDDAGRTADVLDPPDVPSRPDAPIWIDDPMSAAHAELEAALAGQRADSDDKHGTAPDLADGTDDVIRQPDVPSRSTSDGGNWIDDPDGAARGDLDAVLARRRVDDDEFDATTQQPGARDGRQAQRDDDDDGDVRDEPSLSPEERTTQTPGGPAAGDDAGGNHDATDDTQNDGGQRGVAGHDDDTTARDAAADARAAPSPPPESAELPDSAGAGTAADNRDRATQQPAARDGEQPQRDDDDDDRTRDATRGSDRTESEQIPVSRDDDPPAGDEIDEQLRTPAPPSQLPLSADATANETPDETPDGTHSSAGHDDDTTARDAAADARAAPSPPPESAELPDSAGAGTAADNRDRATQQPAARDGEQPQRDDDDDDRTRDATRGNDRTESEQVPVSRDDDPPAGDEIDEQLRTPAPASELPLSADATADETPDGTHELRAPSAADAAHQHTETYNEHSAGDNGDARDTAQPAPEFVPPTAAAVTGGDDDGSGPRAAEPAVPGAEHVQPDGGDTAGGDDVAGPHETPPPAPVPGAPTPAAPAVTENVEDSGDQATERATLREVSAPPLSPTPARADDLFPSIDDPVVVGAETQELLADPVDLNRADESQPLLSPTSGTGDARTAERATPTPDIAGPDGAPAGASDDATDDGTDDSQSRPAGEPTLDPALAHEHVMPDEAEPSLRPAGADTTAAPKRMPEIKRPDHTRVAEREREREKEREKDREAARQLTGHDAPGIEQNNEAERADEPVLAPPPPAPPEPEIDLGIDFGM